MVIKSYEGVYERSVVIEIVKEECNVCGKETKVLKIDGSGGEYSAGTICKECLDDAFVREATENVRTVIENPKEQKDFIKLTDCLNNLHNLQTHTTEKKYETEDIVIAYNSSPVKFKEWFNNRVFNKMKNIDIGLFLGV